MMNLSVNNLTLNEVKKQYEVNTNTKDYLVYMVRKRDFYLELNSPYHSNFFTFILVLEGFAKYSMNGATSVLSKNEVLLSPKFATFVINFVSEDYRAMYIFFYVDFFVRIASDHHYHDVLNTLVMNGSVAIPADEILVSKLLFHAEALRGLSTANKKAEYTYYREMSWNHLSLLIYEIEGKLNKTNISKIGISRDAQIAENFYRLVREHFREEHGVRFYSDSLNITTKHLSKVMKRTVCRVPKDLINNALANEAKLLLRATGANVSEVALILNFSNPTVFSKFFRKHTEKTPFEFKRDNSIGQGES